MKVAHVIETYGYAIYHDHDCSSMQSIWHGVVACALCFVLYRNTILLLILMFQIVALVGKRKLTLGQLWTLSIHTLLTLIYTDWRLVHTIIWWNYFFLSQRKLNIGRKRYKSVICWSFASQFCYENNGKCSWLNLCNLHLNFFS